jgi:hypothetical protein
MARDIDLGDLNNLMDNARANIVELFNLYQHDEIGVRFSEIYNEEIKTPKRNSVAIDIDGFTATQRAWNNRTSIRYTIGINVNIWYYHEDLNEKTRKRDVMQVVWRIANMFVKHVTVNGFCPGLGCEIISTEYTPKITDQKIIAAGLVRVKLNKLFQVVNAD